MTSGFVPQRPADQQPGRRPGLAVPHRPRPAPPRTRSTSGPSAPSRTCSACQAEAGNSAANAATVRTASRAGAVGTRPRPRVGRDATRRVGRPDRRRHWHLDHVPLLQSLQLVEEVTRSAVLLVGDHPVELDRAQHGDIADQLGARSAAWCGTAGPRGCGPRPAGYGPRASSRTTTRAGTAGGPAGPTLPGSPRSGRRRPGSCPPCPAGRCAAAPTVFTPLNPAQSLGCTVNQVDAEPQDEEAEEQAEMRAA